MNILKGLLFLQQKLHYDVRLGRIAIGLRKYQNFKREATHSVFLFDKLKYEIRNKVFIFVSVLKLRHKTSN